MAVEFWAVVLARLGFVLLLASSCVSDWRERRIPNALTLAGLAGALAFHALAPGGAGVFDPYLPGGLGMRESALGAVVALTLLLLPYSRGLIGAGDTKLMAAVGAFVGISALPALLLAVMLAVGGLALVYALIDRRLLAITSHLIQRLPWMVSIQRDSKPALIQPRLPVALAIAAGVAGYGSATYYNLLG